MDFAGHRHGEGLDKADVARHFVVGNLALAKGADVVLGHALAGLGDDPGAQLLAVAAVGHAHHLHVLHLGVAVEEFFDLARVEVLAAANHHVLDAPDDVHIALRVHHGQIAGVHKALVVDGFAGFFGIAPIAVHDGIALGTQLARLARCHDGPRFGVDDFHLQVRLHQADGGDALVQRRIGGALAAHRAGFGHAVGNGHLGHVHIGLHALHHLDRAGAAGHDAGAQGGQVKLFEARVVQLGNEHGRHAVQAGAFFGLHGLQHGERVKTVVRVNNGAAVGKAGQIAQHHAKAVVQRHGNAQAVSRRQLHALTDEKTVVQNVAVRQRRPLREPRGAAGELDVDRVGVAERGGHGIDLRIVGLALGQPVGKTQHARLVRPLPGHINPHHRAQAGQALGRQHAGHAAAQLRGQLAQHAQVVAALELRHGYQRLAADLVQRVLHLSGAVGRVDVHQNNAHLRRGQLHQHPFGVVVRPDAHPVALFQARLQQGAGQLAHRPMQTGIGIAQPLVAADQGLALALAAGHVGKKVTDRGFNQRGVRRPKSVAGRQGGGRAGHGKSPEFFCSRPPGAAHAPRRGWRLTGRQGRRITFRIRVSPAQMGPAGLQ